MRLLRVADGIERCCGFFHKIAAIMTLILVGLTAEQVVARYFFNAGSIRMQELEWHLFGAIFLLAAATTYKKEGHVRVDVLYSRFSERTKAKINFLGAVLALVPTCVILVWTGIDFTVAALSYDTPIPQGASEFERWLRTTFLVGEASPDPGGLPGRWLIKAMIPLGAALLLLQGLVVAVRDFGKIRRTS